MKEQERQTVPWQPWGAQAFERARREGKRVFLSISATWCHWCHVMDEESFAHPKVVRRLREEFVPVRVDSDRRPDINQRYNMGGWPTVAVLDGEGQVVVGATYLPTGQLLAMLSSAKERSAVSLPPPDIKSAEGEVELNEAQVGAVAGALARVYDPHFGGFGGPPKFPQGAAVELALHLGLFRRDPRWLGMATHTLDCMREGEIYDVAEGGFFRYAVGNEWDNPHYEKLLEVNAQLLALYLRAFHLCDALTYRATAQGILGYLLAVLSEEGQAWFYGSQSADREYYRLSDEERLWAESPALDRTCYTDRNAQAASALLLARSLPEEEKLLARGLSLVRFLWERHFRAGQGMVHCDDGATSSTMFLSDQVFMVGALLDAFEATGEDEFREGAEELLRLMDRRLWDGAQGAYGDAPADGEACGLLKITLRPFAENALAAVQLLRLGHLTGRADYRRSAEAVLRHLASVYPLYKHHAAPFGLALCRYLDAPHHLTVVGRREDPRWQALLREAHRVRSPWKVILPLDAERNRARIGSLGYAPEGPPRLYPCVGTTCHPPVSSPEEVSEAVLSLPRPSGP